MLVASLLAVSVFVGAFGITLQPYAPLVALIAAFILSPFIAWLTGGRYYLTRPESPSTVNRKRRKNA